MFDSKVKLSDLQLLLIKVLWRHGMLSAADVHKKVSQQRELAPTTVATMLKRMQEKDWLGYEKNGRQFQYFAKITERDVKTSMLSSLLANLFDGRPDQLLHHLVDNDEFNHSDLEKIQALLNKDTDSEKPQNEDTDSNKSDKTDEQSNKANGDA